MWLSHRSSPHMNGRRRVRRWTMLLVPAIAVAAGCAGSGQSPTGASGQSLGTLRVITSQVHSLGYIAVNAGNELGAWEDTSLRVEIVPGSSGTVTQTMASGDADIGLQGATNIVDGISKGLDATMVAAHGLDMNQPLIVSPNSDAQQVRDLREGTFGISSFGSLGHLTTLKVAEAMGWSKDEYKIVPLGDLQALVAALKRGSIDAFAWNPVDAAAIEARGQGRVLAATGRFVPPTVDSAFYVRNEVIEQRPKALKAFFRGYFNLVRGLNNNPDPARTILVNKWGYKPDVIDELLKPELKVLSTNGHIPPRNLQGLADMVRFLRSIGNQSRMKGMEIQKMFIYWKDIS